MHWLPKHDESMDTFRTAVKAALSEQEDENMTQDTFSKLMSTWQDENDPLYKTLDDVPSYWKEDAAALVETGAIKGDGVNSFGVRASVLKAAIINKRILIVNNRKTTKVRRGIFLRRDFFVYGTVWRPACPVRGGGRVPQNGGRNMTDNQKQSIREMRSSGLGYKKNRPDTKPAIGTVQSFCRRKNITVSGPTVYDENHCRQCGKPLIQKSKVKRRKFCSEECRIKWWTAHPCSKNGDAKSSRTAVCQNCGKTFSAYGNAHRKYCSHSCYVEARFGGGAQ